jgi:hypothetical protein
MASVIAAIFLAISLAIRAGATAHPPRGDTPARGSLHVFVTSADSGNLGTGVADAARLS